MTELNQLYCTHCTYGTSALHRRDGAQGEQVFEYSTRSGSVRREESHDIFRRIEPFMHFRVPGDFPASELVKNTADTLTIRRLIYHPAVSGLRMLAHVSFRTTDTRGRPGSYFAHVLLENHSSGMTPWSAAECLKLWGSKNWKLKDQPDHPFELVPHSSFSGFDGNPTPPINDQTLLSFLTTSAGGVFNDPGGVIPERWRRKSPEDRQAVLVNALQGVLEIDIERRESVLLAVEPSVAALIFYGIARLLPQKGIGEKLSFSTYESHFDRPATILAATCFHNPETADLSPESYSSTARGVTINTFNGRSTPRRRDGAYGRVLVERLVSRGFDGVKELLAACDRFELSRTDELEAAVGLHRLADLLLLPGTQVDPLKSQLPDPKRNPKLRTFLRSKVIATLSKLDMDTPVFESLLSNAPQAILLLTLLTELEPIDPDHAAAQPLIQLLLHRWPPENLAALLKDSTVATVLKKELLSSYLTDHSVLPLGCDFLFAERTRPGDNLLESVCQSLPAKVVEPFLNASLSSVTDSEQIVTRFKIVLRLLASACSDPEKQALFQSVFHHPTIEQSRDQRTKVFDAVVNDRELRSILTKWYDRQDEALPLYLMERLTKMPNLAGSWRENLAILDELRTLMSQKSQHHISEWRNISGAVESLKNLSQTKPNVVMRMVNKRHKEDEDAAIRKLALASEVAFEGVGGDVPQIAERITGFVGKVIGYDALPERFSKRLMYALGMRSYTSPIRKPKSAGSTRNSSAWRSLKKRLALVAAIVAAVSVLSWIAITRPEVRETLSAVWKTEVIPGKPATDDRPANREDQTGSPKSSPLDETKKKTKTELTEKKKAKSADTDISSTQSPSEKGNVKPVRKDGGKPSTLDGESKQVVTADPTHSPVKLGPANPQSNTNSNASKSPAPTEPKKPEWPPSFIKLPQLDSDKRESLFQWATEPKGKIILRGIEELSDQPSATVGNSLSKPMLSSDLGFVGNDNSLAVRWTESVDKPDPWVVCRFWKTPTSLEFQWYPARSDQDRRIQRMIRLCCLDVDDKLLVSLMPESSVIEGNGIADFQDNAAVVNFKSDVDGAEAFVWSIARGRLEFDDKKSYPFELSTQDLDHSDGKQQFKVRLPELAKKHGEFDLSCEFSVVSKSQLQFSILKAVPKTSPSESKYSDGTQNDLKELEQRLTYVIDNIVYPDEKDTHPIDPTKVFQPNKKYAAMKAPELKSWVENLVSAVNKLAPNPKLTTPTALKNYDPKMEGPDLANFRQAITSWARNDAVPSAIKIRQEVLKWQTEKEGFEQIVGVPKRVKRFQIEKLVRFVNKRQIVVFSR